MARNEQLIRQHRILQLLERSRFGWTVNELRDELVSGMGLSSLHVRTVDRDLDALTAAGFDVVSQELPRGRVWKLGPRGRGTYRIAVTATELTALSIGRDLLHPLAGTPFWQGIESFWTKLHEQLPEGVQEHYDQYRGFLRVLGLPAKSYERHHGMLKTINRAILERRRVEIHYQPLGRPARLRRIEPLAVAFYQSSLYILAVAAEPASSTEPGSPTSSSTPDPSAPNSSTPAPNAQANAPISGVCPDSSRIRHFKLDRFQKAELLDEWFRTPEDFRIEDYLGAGVGIFSGSELQTFRIRISSLAATWVLEDPWHPAQQTEWREDGSLDLTVRSAHELEVIPRVLALGMEAELLEPLSSRERVAQIVRELAQRYASG